MLILAQISDFNNELIIFEHLYDDNDLSEIEKIKNIVSGKPVTPFPFKRNNKEKTNLSDTEFKKLVDKGINHCKLGDVFQIVLSKRFYQGFQGVVLLWDVHKRLLRSEQISTLLRSDPSECVLQKRVLYHLYLFLNY